MPIKELQHRVRLREPDYKNCHSFANNCQMCVGRNMCRMLPLIKVLYKSNICASSSVLAPLLLIYIGKMNNMIPEK